MWRERERERERESKKMQAVKDKLSDMKEMRKVKAETKAEERVEKELAKARVDIAHEVRLAKEAEAAMDLHVTKAGERAQREIEKHAVNEPTHANDQVHVGATNTTNEPYGQDPNHISRPTTTTPPTTMGMSGAPARNDYM
ncbi:unnamed protein product [Camellia sinensis]